MKHLKRFDNFLNETETSKNVSRVEIENLLADKNIKLKLDYSWDREDNLNFHQDKSVASKALSILHQKGIKTGSVEYLFGDNYLKIYNLSEK